MSLRTMAVAWYLLISKLHRKAKRLIGCPRHPRGWRYRSESQDIRHCVPPKRRVVVHHRYPTQRHQNPSAIPISQSSLPHNPIPEVTSQNLPPPESPFNQATRLTQQPSQTLSHCGGSEHSHDTVRVPTYPFPPLTLT